MNVSVSLFASPSKEGIALEAQLKKNITVYLRYALEKVSRLTNKTRTLKRIPSGVLNRPCVYDTVVCSTLQPRLLPLT